MKKDTQTPEDIEEQKAYKYLHEQLPSIRMYPEDPFGIKRMTMRRAKWLVNYIKNGLGSRKHIKSA